MIDIEKPEQVLGGLSIEYAPFNEIESEINTILKKLNSTKWLELDIDNRSVIFSKYLAELWKVHGFREGNTRTVVTFCCQYAEEKGFPLDRKLLENNSAYVRHSLVAASAYFSDLGDKSKPEYLINIIKDSMEKGKIAMLNS